MLYDSNCFNFVFISIFILVVSVVMIVEEEFIDIATLWISVGSATNVMGF